ncbi:MAG: hypothetical protein ABSG86_31470, partial [Thermoguttaceae bacterium]
PTAPYGENRDSDSPKATESQGDAVTPSQSDAANSEHLEAGATDRPEGLKADSDEDFDWVEDLYDEVCDAADATSDSGKDATQPTTPAAEDQGRDSGYQPGDVSTPYSENRDGESSKATEPQGDAATPSQGEPGENAQEPARTGEASSPSEEPKVPAQDADKGKEPSEQSSSGEAANTSGASSDADAKGSDAAGATSDSGKDATQPTTPATEDQGRDSGYQPADVSTPYGQNRDGESSKAMEPQGDAVTPQGDAASSGNLEGASTDRPEDLKADSDEDFGWVEDLYDEASDGPGSGPSAGSADLPGTAGHTTILSAMGEWLGRTTARVEQVLRLVSGELASKG